MDKDKILELAGELGNLIAHSDLKKRADEANKALSTDEEALELINGYNDKREAKMSEFAEKQPTAEEAQAVNEYLQTEFNKIAENPVIGEYIQANQEFENVLNQMDQIIKTAISGGCSGSCSSCSGCH